MREYYGELTHEEYACIPKFDYHVVDVSSMTEVELERIPSSLLGTFLYTLFLGVRPELVLQKLKQTANFVSGLMSLEQWIEIYEIITAYLSSVSPEFEQKFKDMKYVLSHLRRRLPRLSRPITWLPGCAKHTGRVSKRVLRKASRRIA
jgi:hypothetical protein